MSFLDLLFYLASIPVRFSWALGLGAGAALLWWNAVDEKKESAALWGSLAGVALLLPPICWMVADWLSGFDGVPELKYGLGAWVVTSVASLFAVFGWFRWITPMFRERVVSKITRKAADVRDQRTDVRTIEKLLPPAKKQFDPRQYFKDAEKKDSIFLGLSEERTDRGGKRIAQQPVLIAYDDWQISHCLLTGRTRSGKGVAAQTLLSQAIARGEFTVILDPKVDSWMPHIYREAAIRAGLPYTFLDVRQTAPAQINIFEDCDKETIENMLIGGFSLSEKGEAADFYRLADRAAARDLAEWLEKNPGATAADAVAEFGDLWAEKCAGFDAYMRELAEIPAINCKSGGYDLAEGEQTGGCLYVVGDMINPRILRIQRMILLRLMFLAKNRDHTRDDNRTICVFADEFKCHISRPFTISLGASAGWGLHCILAFQSLQDLADCPADLDKDAVRGSVMENCAIQLSYAIKDPDTAEWLARSTGTILVDDETRKIDKNVALSELISEERSIRLAERYLIDENMFRMLPKGCGVFSLPGQVSRFAYTSPTPVKRGPDALTPTTPGKAPPPLVSTSPDEKIIDITPPAVDEVAQRAAEVDAELAG